MGVCELMKGGSLLRGNSDRGVSGGTVVGLGCCCGCVHTYGKRRFSI